MSSRVVITPDGLGRIKAAVEDFEGRAVFHSTRPPTRRHMPGNPIKHAIVTTAIPAATAGTPNAPNTTGGVVTLYDWDPAAHTYAAGQTGIPAYNDAPVAIVVGTQIKVCLQDGDWFVIWYLC